jgi:hypothetical protein
MPYLVYQEASIFPNPSGGFPVYWSIVLIVQDNLRTSQPEIMHCLISQVMSLLYFRLQLFCLFWSSILINWVGNLSPRNTGATAKVLYTSVQSVGLLALISRILPTSSPQRQHLFADLAIYHLWSQLSNNKMYVLFERIYSKFERDYSTLRATHITG